MGAAAGGARRLRDRDLDADTTKVVSKGGGERAPPTRPTRRTGPGRARSHSGTRTRPSGAGPSARKRAESPAASVGR